ncbi:MAG: hypothetical protein ACI9LM_003088 [Alteromonadaceae bacterium]|jgi:hypothetical protein
MMNLYKPMIMLFCLLFMTSCSTEVTDYQHTRPKFDIKSYFDGELIAWGMVQDYSDLVTRRFCVELNARWQNNQGELDEIFYFDDGEISYRTWQLTKLKNDQYSGTAEDVVGSAKGKQSGHAFQWQYQLLVPIDGKIVQFDMDDWMYQIDQYRVFNRTKMNKFGVNVAEITLFFDKETSFKKCLPKRATEINPSMPG